MTGRGTSHVKLADVCKGEGKETGRAEVDAKGRASIFVRFLPFLSMDDPLAGCLLLTACLYVFI